MSRKNHNPSLMRKVRRNLKNGENSKSLLSIANTITDPYYLSLSLYSIGFSFSVQNQQSEKILASAQSEISKVKQDWRRIELLGEIAKLSGKISNHTLKEDTFRVLLAKALAEKDEHIKDFFVSSSKLFPPKLLDELLSHSGSVKGYEFVSSKAVVRSWLAKKSPESLVPLLSEIKGNLGTKLLGYCHLQLHKSKIDVRPTALEIALKRKIVGEELMYLVRISSTKSDFQNIYEQISTLESEKALPVFLALSARADRKNLKFESERFLDESKLRLEDLQDSQVKSKFANKIKVISDRLKGLKSQNISVPKEPTPPLSEKSKHTLALYNTYGGKWNHPHFKAVFKASNLCAAFDLKLALIDFPEIKPERLIFEIKKEMRLPDEGYISSLFNRKRIRFFDEDVDESWAGTKIATTANPQKEKLDFPNGEICMVMGLGPKGLPKIYLKKSKYHFELTGSNIAFETGTAMGAIAGRLSRLQ